MRKNICFSGVSVGCRSLKNRSVTPTSKAFSKRHQKAPSTCQQLFTTPPNSPILSAAVNGQAVRQAAMLFACMIRRTPVCMCVTFLMPLLVVVRSYLSVGTTRVSRFPSLLLHAAAVVAVCCCRCCCILLPLLLLLLHAADAGVMLLNTAAGTSTTAYNTSGPCLSW